MSDLLSSHLEQIATCARSISELPFPGPKAFTNAILSTGDITRLIRDTEPQERALYQLAPPPTIPQSDVLPTGYGTTQPANAKTRRTTVHAVRQSRNRAIAAVLDKNLYDQIQRQPAKGEVDVELLLQGAKKLASVYPIPGALDRIAKLQRRAQQLETNIAHYEARISEQRQELEQMNIPVPLAEDSGNDDDDDDHISPEKPVQPKAQNTEMSTNEPAAMVGDIEHLEQRKKALEDRVSGMDRDLNELTR